MNEFSLNRWGILGAVNFKQMGRNNEKIDVAKSRVLWTH